MKSFISILLSLVLSCTIILTPFSFKQQQKTLIAIHNCFHIPRLKKLKRVSLLNENKASFACKSDK